MGNKTCGGETGTPWVNFSINCVRVNNSENINIDRPDGPANPDSLDDSDNFEDLNSFDDSNSGLNSCCLPWPRRYRKAKNESEKSQTKI